MRIISVLSTGVLTTEFVLHGAAMLSSMEAGVKPLADHLGFRPGRPVTLLIGTLDLAAAAGLVAGLREPGIGVAASGYGVLFFGSLMALRLRRRLGTVLWPPDFPLFLSLSVVNLISHSVR